MHYLIGQRCLLDNMAIDTSGFRAFYIRLLLTWIPPRGLSLVREKGVMFLTPKKKEKKEKEKGVMFLEYV